MVDCRRGCDGVEVLVYGCMLMGMKVVPSPIHCCCDEGVGPELRKQRRDGEVQWAGMVTRKGREGKYGEALTYRHHSLGRGVAVIIVEIMVRSASPVFN